MKQMIPWWDMRETGGITGMWTLGTGLPIPEDFESWTEKNGCVGEPVETYRNGNVSRMIYSKSAAKRQPVFRIIRLWLKAKRGLVSVLPQNQILTMPTP